MMYKSINDSVLSHNKNRENITVSSYHDVENIMTMLARNEQAIIEMRKELKLKVNKTEFLTGLSGKISLSDISSLELGRYDETANSHTTLQETMKQYLHEETTKNNKVLKEDLQKQLQSLRQSTMTARSEKQNWQEYMDRKECQLLRLMREGEQCLLDKLQKKGERSELDKIMHLSSLLGIQFELIKKRFGNFEVDYNLIWKQISNLYAYQQNIKSAIDTQRAASKQNQQKPKKKVSIKEKQLQLLLKTGKSMKCINSLFNSIAGSAEKQQEQEIREMHPMEIEHELRCINQRLQQHRKSQTNIEFTINSFSDRLEIIEKNYENWFKSLKEVQKLKRQVTEATKVIDCIEDRSRKLKEEMVNHIDVRIKEDMNSMNASIKGQIKEACEQITSKIMIIFEQCARDSDIQTINIEIDRINKVLDKKMSELLQTHSRTDEKLTIRQQQQEDKIRLIRRELETKLKVQDFQKVAQSLITTDSANTLIKKTQNLIKQEFNRFSSDQKGINEIICSETVVARWTWISGQLKGGNLVSWDKQIINTLPQNFVYSNKQCCFRVMNSGIYKIQMGFYAKKKPTIQIIVNGQTVLSAVNNNSYVMHHSSGKLKDFNNSEVTGLTFYDFLTLPQNSRLAISYQGDLGHGFLGIHRL